MLQGTGILDHAVRIDQVATEPLELPGAELLQVIYEFPADGRDDRFPPALHPVNPPCLAWSFLRAPSSTLGPFALAEARLICRSGMRTRGFQVACTIDSAAVAAELASRWGFIGDVGDVRLSRRYDGATGTATLDGEEIEVGHVRPLKISPGDLQYTASMHAVELDRGIRLLQIERAYEFAQAERGVPFARPARDGWYPVSASSAVADVTLKPPRFACRPDVTAFEGTEPV
jgi:hypothetical protein